MIGLALRMRDTLEPLIRMRGQGDNWLSDPNAMSFDMTLRRHACTV